jgi:hypothetical protein
MKKSLAVVVLACLMLASCIPERVSVVRVQQLCPMYNPVFIEHHGNDSAMFWIPNCFAPGDSTSSNDSLVEFTRNMAQVVVTIRDSVDSILMAYNVQNYQYPGFASRTVWYGNYNYVPAPEKCYNLKVTGITMYGTTFTMYGTVSLLRYFFGRVADPAVSKILINCDTCNFSSQWNGTNVNYQQSSGETFVPDAFHVCN